MKTDASEHPISAQKMQKSTRMVPVDIFSMRAGMTKAITSMAMNMPQ